MKITKPSQRIHPKKTKQPKQPPSFYFQILRDSENKGIELFFGADSGF